MQLFEYQVLDDSRIEPFVKNNPCIVVYDKRPAINFPNAILCDLNNFKISTWMNTFNQKGYKTIIFQVEKFSADSLYAFFRNIHNDTIVFTDDIIFREIIIKNSKANIKINIIPSFIYTLPPELQTPKIFEKWISEIFQPFSDQTQISDQYQITTEFYKFLKLTLYKLNILITMMKTDKNYNQEIAVLSTNDYISHMYSNVISARQVADRSAVKCFVLDFDETFDYSGFSTSIIFISNQNLKKSEGLINMIDSKHLDICKTFFKDTGMMNTSQIHMLREILTAENFLEYLSERTMIDHAKIAKYFTFDYSSYYFMKLKEITCGNSTFPFSYSRSMLEHLVLVIKTTLEQSFIYIKGLHPTIVVNSGGFMNKEFCAVVSLPEIFDFECAGEPCMSKRDTVLHASAKYIMKLAQEAFIDENFNIVPSKLFELQKIRDLYMMAYGTVDLGRIAQLQSNFTNESKICQGQTIVEENGVVFISGENRDMAREAFKKKYAIDFSAAKQYKDTPKDDIPKDPNLENVFSFYYADEPTARLQRFYRKIPNCLAAKMTHMSLYVFSNSKTGLLCGTSFKESCYMVDEWGKDLEISYGGTREYTSDEVKILVFYQVIFFKMHNEIFNNGLQTFSLYYYAVPLDNEHKIDWTYLNEIYSRFIVDYVYNNRTANNLIWNPFSHEFFVYADEFNANIEDPVGNSTFLKFFEDRYGVNLSIKNGKMMFKGYLASNILSKIKKWFNLEQSISSDPDEACDEITHKSESLIEDHPFECKPYNPQFISRVFDVSSSYYPAISNFGFTSVCISSAECCFITAVKTTTLFEIEVFKRNYARLENYFIADEMRRAYCLNLSLMDIVKCFTQASESLTDNYERLEFIGDCALKFITTNYLYLSGLSMDFIVSVKDYIICNRSLFTHCVNSGIYKYLKTHHFLPKMVQAPVVSGADECMKYFDATAVFKSDNYNVVVSNSGQSQDVKIYADMVEAIIGALFLADGVNKCAEFIYKLGIIKPMELNNGSADHHTVLDEFLQNTLSSLASNATDNPKNKPNPEVAMYCSVAALPFNRISTIADQDSLFFGKPFTEFIYCGILPTESIEAIESTIGYCYVNPGNLERALVHPSSTSALGNLDFQYLELIGDCALDLFVTNILSQNTNLNTPLLLHSYKKACVNNNSLHKLFKMIGLDKHARFTFSSIGYSKMYSDISEALIGSILVDLQWNYEKLFAVMNTKLKHLIEKCMSKVNFD